jgi:transposase-like protein
MRLYSPMRQTVNRSIARSLVDSINLLNSLFKMATRGAAAATFIVDGNTILNEDAMLLEKFSLRRLTFPTKFNVLEWTARRRLIKNSRQCENCNAPMSLITKTRRTDGYGWRCKTCKKEQSIRDGSFFSGSHLSIETIIVIVYCWANDFPQKNIIAEAELSPTTSNTVVDWCSFCRDVCEQDLISHPTEIGGLDEDTLEPKIVEIDESKLHSFLA